MAVGVCAGEGPHGPAAACDAVVAPLAAEADFPQCQAWAGGADFEKICKRFSPLPPPSLNLF